MSAAWALFLGALARHGFEPSGPLILPIARHHYYAAEAFLVFPTYLAMWAVMALVGHAMAKRLGGQGLRSEVLGVAGVAMALPSVLLWLVPDVLVILMCSFASLPKAMPYYVPLSLVGTVGLLAHGLQRTHRLPMGRALLAASVAAVLHWMVGMPVLR